MDSSTGKDVSTVTKSDSGVVKDAETVRLMDSSCGSPSGSDWCELNAPLLGAASTVLCDDFDKGVLSSAYNWEGLAQTNFVNTRYVSPFCSLNAQISPDAGMAGLQRGAFTEHPYNGAPSTGAAALAFDLYVQDAACDGAVIAYFVALPGVTMPSGALEAWLTLTNVTSSGYTVTLAMTSGPVDGDAGAATPVSVTVTPSVADKGWARISLDMTTYTLASSPTPTTGTATVSWSHIGTAAAAGASQPATASGQITTAGATNLALDVGLLPNPNTEISVAGCQLFVDDFVTSLPAN